MSADAPTPLDLDAIRKMYGPRAGSMSNSLYRIACALVDEVERLRAEEERPAPAWDEEAVGPLQALAVQWDARAAYNADQGGEFRKGMAVKGRQCADDLRRALAAVREHAPIKPGRETAARAIFDAEFPDITQTERDVEWRIVGSTDHARERGTAWHRQGDAMLDLWPGRSEAEVKAEALREFADAHRFPSHWIMFRRDGGTGVTVSDMLREAADRLAAGGGDDRG